MNLTFPPSPRFSAVLKKAPAENTPSSAFSVRGQEYFATAEDKTELDKAVRTLENSYRSEELGLRRPNFYVQEDPAITLAFLKRELAAKAE